MKRDLMSESQQVETVGLKRNVFGKLFENSRMITTMKVLRMHGHQTCPLKGRNLVSISMPISEH